MIQLDDLTMSRKLLILVIVGIIAIIVVGFVGISATSTINGQLQRLYENKYAHSVLAVQAYNDMLSYAVEGYRFSMEPDMAKKQDMVTNNMEPNRIRFNEKLTTYESIPMDDEEKEVVGNLKQASAEYFVIVGKVNSLTLEGKEEEAAKIRNEQAGSKRAEVMTGIQNLVELNNQTAFQYYSDAHTIYTTIVIMTTVITIICAAILLFISWFIIRNLTRRFNLLLAGMNEVGMGNLSHRISMTGKDEITHIGSSFDQMTANLEKQNGEITANLEKSQRTNAVIINIVEEVKRGNLDVMIDTASFDGEFLVMVDGINALVESFVHPLKEAMRIVNEFATGTFSARYDEHAVVSGDFETFKKSLNYSGTCVSDAITAIQHELDDLMANAQEANASTEEVSASARDISDSSTIVSENAEKSSSGVEQILKAMEDLNTTVNQVAMKTEEVSKLTTEADGLSKDGAILAGIADKGMVGITTSTKESSIIIGDIRRQMEEIGKIIGLIRDVSDQTGLLALNAAIEAARAGEAGLGFAVVADEVKTLARETQSSAENISVIIANLQQRTVEAADSMEKTSQEVEDGGKALGDTLSTFTRIVELITDINRNMGDVAAATEEQAASVEEITASIHEVGDLVRDTAKEADKSAHSTNDVAEAVNQISGVMNNLNEIVENVSRQVKFFRI